MQNQGRRVLVWTAARRLVPLSEMGCRRKPGRNPGKEEHSLGESFKEGRAARVLCCKEDNRKGPPSLPSVVRSQVGWAGRKQKREVCPESQGQSFTLNFPHLSPGGKRSSEPRPRRGSTAPRKASPAVGNDEGRATGSSRGAKHQSGPGKAASGSLRLFQSLDLFHLL